MANRLNNIMPISDPDIRLRPSQHMTSACSGAIVCSLFTTPLDVVKIRMQAQQKAMLVSCNTQMTIGTPARGNIVFPRNAYYKGIADAMLQISRREGVTTLWSGLSPTLVLAVPSMVIYLAAFEQMKEGLGDYYAAKTKDCSQPVWIPLLAGVIARTVSAVVLNPIELIRTKMQSEKKSFYETRRHISRAILAEGPQGLWRGLGATLMREVPFSGIYWVCYESIKKYFGKTDIKQSNIVFNFMAAGFSGCVSAVMTLPFDVVKTHQQIGFGEHNNLGNHKENGIAKTMLEIRKHEGTSGLFRGLVPRLIKVAPACAIMISSFEFGKTFFHNYNLRIYYQMQNEEN